MKKYIVLFLLPFAFACGNGGENESNPMEDSLNMVNKGLQNEVGQKDSAITQFIRSFNEIQDNLDLIKQKEKIITVSSKDVEHQKTQKDQIVDDIQIIYDLMAKNKEKLAIMNKKMKKANVRIGELEKMIEHLNTQLLEKDGEIADLKSQLEKLNIELTDLTINYNSKVEESAGKTEQLNTAYYAFGTSKELIKQGVLTKEGGFIGIGKATKLKDDFNKNYFTKIDITKNVSIPLACKKAKLVTAHSSGSYKLEGEGKVDKIIITNPEEFWATSKYLVIVVE